MKEYSRKLVSWENYVNHDILPSGFCPMVIESWKRSKTFKVDPLDRVPISFNENIPELLAKSKKLLDFSGYLTSLIETWISPTGFLLILSDSLGNILLVRGEEKILKKAEENHLFVGVNRSEEKAGTNAISLAITEGKPCQIVGPEHYKKTHHDWTCSAAPIYDEQARLVGVINLSGPANLNHTHTLGIVISLAQAIEREYRIRERNQTLRVAHERLRAVLDSITEAVLVVDVKGCFSSCNVKFQQLFKLEADESLTLTEVAEIFGKVIDNNEESLNEERVLKVGASFVNGIVTIRKIRDIQEKIVGAVAIITERKAFYHQATQLIGPKATITFDRIIHGDSKMSQTIELAKIASVSNTRILLEGESGTGKEMFAQAIHNMSSRQNGPFVAVNCSAIPRELIESELFGYVEGAFTGAKKSGKPGKFELAENGTLFLDEITSMPFEMQTKLLRVLQQNEVTRLGDNRPININVRIIAAANGSVEQSIEEGSFRLDLFYRLGVIVIQIPPLRERKEDIPLLFDYLINKIGTSIGKKCNYDANEIISAFQTYDWPGNVRELENYVERAIVLSQGNHIRLSDFPKQIVSQFAASIQRKPEKPLNVREKDIILEALIKENFNISKVAEKLEISRNTLYKKIKHYQISRKE